MVTREETETKMTTKPNGIALGMGPNGPTMRVTMSDRVTDAIWKAVEDARLDGWTVERFRAECAEAWAQDQRDDQRSDEDAWRKSR